MVALYCYVLLLWWWWEIHYKYIYIYIYSNCDIIDSSFIKFHSRTVSILVLMYMHILGAMFLGWFFFNSTSKNWGLRKGFFSQIQLSYFWQILQKEYLLLIWNAAIVFVTFFVTKVTSKVSQNKLSIHVNYSSRGSCCYVL